MADESMSPDLVALTRQAFDAWNRRDFDAAVRLWAPDAVWEVQPLGTKLEGVAAIRDFLQDWIGAFEELEIDVEELLDVGNGVVFVVLIQQGRPVGSMGDVRYRFAWVSTWADGFVVRVTGYHGADIEAARVAAERLAEERG